MEYINLLGISGSGKSTFFEFYNYPKKLNMMSQIIKFYNFKSIKQIRYLTHLTTPQIKHKVDYIFENYLSDRLHKLTKYEKLKYKLNLLSKFHYNLIVSKMNPNFVIEDEGILSFIDNYYINPIFIEDSFNFERIIDEFYLLPNKVIYLDKSSNELKKIYEKRKDKPWKINNDINLIDFFEKSKKKYDFFLNQLLKKYNIEIIYEK